MAVNNHNVTKSNFLGMPAGTAAARLRKKILFHLLQRLHEDVCFQCGKKIETAEELSIEHKLPWLHKDVALFWDLTNIAFSHSRCNSLAAKRIKGHTIVHGTTSAYIYGCRCKSCKEAHRIGVAEFRKRRSS